MKNVLEIIDGGFIGGGQTHILSLVKNLNKKNFKPVIAASANGEFKNIVKKADFEFVQVELPKIYRSKHLKDLDAIVKSHNIDIIHSHGGVAGMYSRFYKKKFNKVKVIHTIHGIHYIHSPNIFRKIFSQSIEQYLVPFTDWFICVSDSDFETALKNKIIQKDNSIVIQNGIDTSRFAKRDKNKSLMIKHGIKETDIIIGNISRFDFQKNQRFIIRNSDDVLSKYPDVKILLAGDGKYLEQCKALVKASRNPDKFIFTGEIDNAEEYYSLIDIFVFPSLWEGLSISLIEAMASGMCIMASGIAANRELIKDLSNGIIFETGDENIFKSWLERLIADKELRDKLSKRAETDSRNYSEEIMAAKISEQYFKLTG